MVRRARPDDADAIAALHARSRAAYYGDSLSAEDAGHDRRPMWRRLVTEHDALVLCAIVDEVIIGFCCLRRAAAANEVELQGLYIEPGRFGTGVAETLYVSFVAECRGRAARLEVWDRNERAKAFYRRRGWVPSDQTRPGPADTPFVTWRLPPESDAE
ncbi:N-acetyltransferase [Microbacterium testaceum]|nr:N-acetyltransferase [Microbacterium testaceum]